MILLTGGTGFVGGHLAHRLRAEERPVRALVRDRRRGSKVAALGCELAVGDMTDAASLRAAVAGCDAVIHLVAVRQGRRERFERVMVAGTQSLVAAAREAGVSRFVHMSALGTSEESKDLVPYYWAKWETEREVEQSGLPHVIFRPSFIFARDGGILPTFRRIARVAPVTPIPGAGRQRIQPIWIDDLTAYFSAALDKPEATNRIFELGGPDVVSWNEFWDRLKRALRIRRPSLHVPMALMRLNAVVAERLPGDVPLTRDLLKMLEFGDNVVTNADAVETFRLPLVSLDEQLRRAA